MEKEEIQNHIKSQFEEIAKLEDTKKIEMDQAKNLIMEILKGSIPEIAGLEHEIDNCVNEIKSAALELKENYSCDFGRVFYIDAWKEDKEGVRIQGIHEKQDLFTLLDDDSAIEEIVQSFICKISREGGDED